MRIRVSQPAVIVLASSSVVLVTTWRVLQWRARKRAKETVDRVTKMLREGPLIDYENPQVRKKILSGAIKRASKWLSLSLSEAKQMAGQVGGVSVHKKPLLSLQPDYVLKPLQTDHRGVREMAFYEAIEVATRNSLHAYSLFLTTGVPEEPRDTSTMNRCSQYLDTWAVALSFLWKDPVVTGSEAAVKDAWKQVRREMETLNQMTKFVAPYYGVVGQRKVLSSAAYGVSPDAHLMLQDVTNSFTKPCVMDLKMGTQSYEPDAPNAKRIREFGKYPQQKEFGFRIVGMRYFEPSDTQRADENGYVFVGKQYGRSLATREQVLGALRRFFTAGMMEEPEVVVTNGDATSAAASDDEGDKDEETKNGTKNNNNVATTTESAEEANGETPTDNQVNNDDADAHEKKKKRLRIKSISNLLLQVRSLRRWVEENESRLRFYASSLLIVFEGDMSKSSSSSLEDQGIATLRMIDFGRVRRRTAEDTSTTDQGYLHGVQSFHDLLTEILEEEKERLLLLKQKS